MNMPALVSVFQNTATNTRRIQNENADSRRAMAAMHECTCERVFLSQMVFLWHMLLPSQMVFLRQMLLLSQVVLLNGLKVCLGCTARVVNVEPRPPLYPNNVPDVHRFGHIIQILVNEAIPHEDAQMAGARDAGCVNKQAICHYVLGEGKLA